MTPENSSEIDKTVHKIMTSVLLTSQNGKKEKIKKLLLQFPLYTSKRPVLDEA